MMMITIPKVSIGEIAFLPLEAGSLFTNESTHVLRRAHRYSSAFLNLCRKREIRDLLISISITVRCLPDVIVRKHRSLVSACASPRAYDERSGYLPAVRGDFVFESVRNEPRFRAIMENMGVFPSDWPAPACGSMALQATFRHLRATNPTAQGLVTKGMKLV